MKVNNLSAILLQPLLPDSLWRVRGDNPSHPNQSLLLQGWWCGTPARSPDSLSWTLNVCPLSSHTAVTPHPDGACSGCHSPLDVQANGTSSRWALTQHTAAEGADTPSLEWGVGNLGPKDRGVESEWVKIRQEAERGLLNYLIELRENMSKSTICARLQRGLWFTASVSHSAHGCWPGSRTQSCGRL